MSTYKQATTFALADDLRQRITEESERLGISRSSLVTMILKEHFEGGAADAQKADSRS